MRYIYRVTIQADATPEMFVGHFEDLSGPLVAGAIKASTDWEQDPAPLAAVARAANYPTYGALTVKRAGRKIGRVIVEQIPFWGAA
jgi:hypothetical protein